MSQNENCVYADTVGTVKCRSSVDVLSTCVPNPQETGGPDLSSWSWDYTLRHCLLSPSSEMGPQFLESSFPLVSQRFCMVPLAKSSAPCELIRELVGHRPPSEVLRKPLW